MKMAKVFVGGKDCEFNKFFYKNRFKKERKNSKSNKEEVKTESK